MSEQKSSIGKFFGGFEPLPKKKFRWTIEFVKTDGTVILEPTFIRIQDRPGIEDLSEKNLRLTMSDKPEEAIQRLCEYIGTVYQLSAEGTRAKDLNGKLILYTRTGSLIETWHLGECRFVSVTFGEDELQFDLAYETIEHKNFTEN